MPLIDIAVVLLVLGGTAGSAVWLWRRGTRGGPLLTAGCAAFYGVVLAVTMAAHSADVLSRLVVGTGHGGAAFVYDFRTYALLLLGALLFACGSGILRTVPGLGGRSGAARSTALRMTLLSLAVVAPLIPIHGVFAIPVTGIGLLTLLVLRFARADAPQPAALPGPVKIATAQEREMPGT